MSPRSRWGSEIGDGLVDHAGRDHQPDGARLRQLLDELGQRGRADGFLLHQLGDRLRGHVVHDAFVPAPHEPAHHVRAHPAEADHSQLHALSSSTDVTIGRRPKGGVLEDVDELAVAPGDLDDTDDPSLDGSSAPVDENIEKRAASLTNATK